MHFWHLIPRLNRLFAALRDLGSFQSGKTTHYSDNTLQLFPPFKRNRVFIPSVKLSVLVLGAKKYLHYLAPFAISILLFFFSLGILTAFQQVSLFNYGMYFFAKCKRQGTFWRKNLRYL